MSVQTTYNDSPPIGFHGMLADNGTPRDVKPMINADTVSIAFGRAVIYKSGGNAQDARLPSAQADKVVGIVLHSNAYSRAWTDSNGTFGDLDSVGLRPGVMMNVLRRGRIMVYSEDGVTKGDRLWVRAISAEDGTEFYGGLNNAADASKMIDCTGQGQWQQTAAAGELSILDCDFMQEA